MVNTDIIDQGPREILTLFSAEDVPSVRQGGDLGPGAVRSTARIEVNSLLVNAIAEGNAQAVLPDWMTGSIDALHANIGRDHGLASLKYKASPVFHESKSSSYQPDFVGLTKTPPRTGLDSHSNGGDITRYFYLWKYDVVRYVSERLVTNAHFTKDTDKDKHIFIVDHHFAVYTDFVLTGSDDIYVSGHTGEHTIVRGNTAFAPNITASDFDAWNTDAVTFTYVGNSGNNTFEMTWGYYEINLFPGGNNHVVATGGYLTRLTLSDGDNIVQISGGAIPPSRLDLRNGNNIIEISPAATYARVHGGTGDNAITITPTFANGGFGLRAEMWESTGNNTIVVHGADNIIWAGSGNDTITVTNDWDNGGHAGNWSASRIDLSRGGDNRVEVTGNTQSSGPTRAEISLGSGHDTIVAHDHTLVTILGANSTGNHTITLHGSAGHPGAVHTGFGRTAINWNGGNYVFEFGSGDLAFTTGGDLYQRFVFDGSERTANDLFVLNNWRAGGVIHTGEGQTTIHWNHGDYDFQFGSGDLTFRTGGDLHLRFIFDGSERTGNDTLILNNCREGGVVHTGQGHTNVWLNYGIYDFHLGSGSVNMSVNGHHGFSTIHDAEGNVIVGRVDGQSSVAQAVHTFSAGDGINLRYSLELGGGVDKVQFYAGSGNYQVTSSANADIFQLDIFGAGGTEGAAYEVFDFKWGADQIMAANGLVYDEHLLTDGNTVRLQYMGEENGRHAFDVVASPGLRCL